VRILFGAFPLVELGEWELAVVHDFELTERDRRLTTALCQGDKRLVVEELREGTRIQARSWIGEVRFESWGIRVVPKLVGGNLGVVEMLDYASGLHALDRFHGERELATSKDGSLVDLLGLLLAEACARLIRDGLLQDYVVHEETLPAMRGRLLYDRQVRRRFGRLDQLECRFDEFETDIIENRLLANALGVARRMCQDDGVRGQLARAHGVFEAACDASAFSMDEADELVYQRRNSHYRTAHALGKLFLCQLAVADLYAPGATRSFVFLIDMNTLFEDFVTQLLIDAFSGSDVQVHAQPRDRSLIRDDRTGKPYAAVIPDLLLERRGPNGRHRVPVDAKYKLYDEGKLDSADVYQTFFYAYAYAREVDREAQAVRAFIVYPASSQPRGTRLRVENAYGVASASIHALPLDVPSAIKVARTGVGMKDLAVPTLVAESMGIDSGGGAPT